MPPRLLTSVEFRTSRYADVADQVDNIDTIIEQAEDHLERLLGRRLSKTTYIERHEPTTNRIYLAQRPIIAVLSVERRSDDDVAWSPIDLSNIVVEPGGASGVLATTNDVDVAGYEVRVTYEAGYDPIPPSIKAAVILQTVLLAYQDLEVYGAGDAKEPATRHLQRQIDTLIAPFRTSRLR